MACQQGVVYTQFISLPSDGWAADSILTFQPEIADTTSQYDIMMVIRHTDRYDYQNIWLFVDIIQDSILLRRDTINGMLADDNGKWYSKGMFVLEYPLLYLEDMRLSQDSQYTIRLQQAMREEQLHGITDIGLKLIKHGKE